MLDHKDVLRTLVRSMNTQTSVLISDAPYGYVIRSENTAESGAMRTRTAQFLLAVFLVSALVIWIAPSGITSFAVNGLISLVCLAIGFIAFALLRSNTTGIELQVDLKRRELRSAVVTSKGESWIRSTGRFEDVSDIYLRHTVSQADAHSLCLRMVGQDHLMPVAFGSEKILLSVHDRLARDLSPMKQRISDFGAIPPAHQVPAMREVFPQLGPQHGP